MGAAAVLILTVSIFAAAVACSGGGSNLTPEADAPTVVPSISTAVPDAQTTPTAAAAVAVNTETVAAGRAVFIGGGGCAACHAIDGVSQGVLGPDLNGIATVAAGRIPGYTAEQYLRESIVDSCAYTTEGTDCNLMLNVMNTISLTDSDVDALVAFLLQQR